MSFKEKLFESKDKFYKIFDKNIEKEGTFITCNGKLSYDDLINDHLDFWVKTRIDGVSVSMIMYAEDLNAIKLIDELSKDYFK